MTEQLAVLVLGVGTDQLPGLKACTEIGLKIFGLDGNPNAAGAKFCDYFECCNIKDPEETLNIAKKINRDMGGFDGCMAFAVEVGPSVGKIVDWFGLPGIGYETALKLTDKNLRNRELEKMGIAYPKSAIILDSTNPPKWDIFPCVTKPANESAAVGVVVKNTPAELSLAPAGHIIQEYVEGWEVSTEAMIFQNGIGWVCHADRNYDKKNKWPPYMLEDGFQLPSKLPERIKRKIELVVEKIIHHFKLRSCAIKLDLIIKDNTVYVLEIAPRLGGGKLSSVGIPLACGTDWWKFALCLAMRTFKEASLDLSKVKNHVAQRWVFPEHPTSHKDRIKDFFGVAGNYEAAIAKAEASVRAFNDRNP